MYEIVIVRYGEIFLKSEFVRKRFEDILVENLKSKLRQTGEKGTIIRKRHRIYVKTDNAEKAADNLANIFGVVSVSPATETRADLEEICNLALEFSRNIIRDNDRFAVRAERTGRHNFSSRDVEVAVGREIQNSINAVVDLENPSKTIFIEIRDELAFIFDRKIAGVGGLPYGTQGRIIALISDDAHSGIAAWMMMRRGCEIIAVHTGNSSRKILEILNGCSPRKIKEHEIKETYEIYKTLEDIAEKESAHGIVTVDNIEKFIKLKEHLKIPIYWPLVGLGEDEIDKIKKRCGF